MQLNGVTAADVNGAVNVQGLAPIGQQQNGAIAEGSSSSTSANAANVMANGSSRRKRRKPVKKDLDKVIDGMEEFREQCITMYRTHQQSDINLQEVSDDYLDGYVMKGDKLLKKAVDLEHQMNVAGLTYEDAAYNEQEFYENPKRGGLPKQELEIVDTEIEPLNQMLTEYVNQPIEKDETYRRIEHPSNIHEMIEKIRADGKCLVLDSRVPKEEEKYIDFLEHIMVCVNKRVRLANRDFSFEDYPGVDPEEAKQVREAIIGGLMFDGMKDLESTIRAGQICEGRVYKDDSEEGDEHEEFDDEEDEEGDEYDDEEEEEDYEGDDEGGEVTADAEKIDDIDKIEIDEDSDDEKGDVVEGADGDIELDPVERGIEIDEDEDDEPPISPPKRAKLDTNYKTTPMTPKTPKQCIASAKETSETLAVSHSHIKAQSARQRQQQMDTDAADDEQSTTTSHNESSSAVENGGGSMADVKDTATLQKQYAEIELGDSDDEDDDIITLD